MTREQLAHILLASARTVNDPRILVIGSQPILASYPETELPEAAWISIEADIAFLDDDEEAMNANDVDGAIGEMSHPAAGTRSVPTLPR